MPDSAAVTPDDASMKEKGPFGVLPMGPVRKKARQLFADLKAQVSGEAPKATPSTTVAASPVTQPAPTPVPRGKELWAVSRDETGRINGIATRNEVDAATPPPAPAPLPSPPLQGSTGQQQQN